MSVDRYSPEDKAKVSAIFKWLDSQGENGRLVSRGMLAKKAGISSTTVSQVLNGKYPSGWSAHLDKLLDAIQLEDERTADGTPGYYKGSVFKLACVVADRTRKHQSFGVLTGHVGVGKTRALYEYSKIKAQTLLIESSPQMTPGVLLLKILDAIGVTAPRGGLDTKFDCVIRMMKGTNYLVIVDEAENCSSMALHYLRRVRDMAEVGIVLAGTEKLHALIAPERGQFDQIRSRVAMWPKTIERISRDDADEISREALRDQFGEISDQVLDELWAYSRGSARVLTEALIGAIKDFIKSDNQKQPITLTAKHVEEVATKVLTLRKGFA